MAFKLVFCIAALAVCVSAKPGGPAEYIIAAPSADHGSVGSVKEHTIKGHYGQTSQSDYSSQVQAGHAQSHVQRSSTTNDAGYAPHAPAQIIAAAPIAHASYATAPAASIATQHYAAAPVASYGIALGHAAYAAPAYSYGHAAPAASYYAAAPAYHGGYYAGNGGHSAAAYYAAPASIKYAATAPAYAAPAYYGPRLGLAAAHYAAPAYAAPAIAAPAYAHYAAPAYAAPVVKAIAHAPALVHTQVAAHGIHYGY